MTRRAMLVAAPAAAGQWDRIFRGLGVKSEDRTALGLKQALEVGTDKAVDLVGLNDGFFRNAAIRIVVPEKMQGAAKALRMVGLGVKVDEFELAMNRAAEKAAPAARRVFKDAVLKMTFVDAARILAGGETAATDYFREKTTAQLEAAFRPAIETAMAETGVARSYRQLTDSLKRVPLVKAPELDVTGYVLGQTVKGLFYMVGQEEKKIRKDPVARITPLLREVFGKR